jgi:HNH endonuclease
MRLLCEICKTNKFEQWHHIDGNPGNNDRSNLMMLCAECHTKEHSTKSNVNRIGPDKLSLILPSSEIEYSKLLRYNNMLVYNKERKLKVVRLKCGSNGRHLEIEFEVLYKNNKGFYEKRNQSIN